MAKGEAIRQVGLRLLRRRRLRVACAWAGWVGGLGALGGFVVPPMLGRIAQKMGSVGYARGYVVYVGLALASLLFTGLLYATRHGVRHAAPAITGTAR